MKVFIVTQGTYSDYHIEAVFSNQEMAKDFVNEYNKTNKTENIEIEVWELDKKREYWNVVLVRMSKDGNVKETWERFNENVGFQCFDVDGNLVWGVGTSDINKAIKVTNEKRIQILANELWGKEIKE